MFVYRRWRRRLQRHVGPRHGRRRAFRSPDRGHGRDSEVADTGRAMTRRTRATDRTARDPARGDTAHDDYSPTSCPATDDTARDGPYRTRSGVGRYRTRRPFFTRRCPATGDMARDDRFLLDDIWLLGYVRLCPVMSGCPDSSAPCIAEVPLGSPVRHEP